MSSLCSIPVFPFMPASLTFCTHSAYFKSVCVANIGAKCLCFRSLGGLREHTEPKKGRVEVFIDQLHTLHTDLHAPTSGPKVSCWSVACTQLDKYMYIITLAQPPPLGLARHGFESQLRSDWEVPRSMVGRRISLRGLLDGDTILVTAAVMIHSGRIWLDI